VNADTQYYPALVGLLRVGGGHPFLQIYGALHGVDRAPKLNQNAIPCGLEHAALMPGNQWFKHSPPTGLEQGQGSGLILLHHPAVSDHIGSQDRGQAQH